MLTEILRLSSEKIIYTIVFKLCVDAVILTAHVFQRRLVYLISNLESLTACVPLRTTERSETYGT